MRFDYEYRTSDNVPHKGTISAGDRDAAFAALKARGVRPAKVVASPGLANHLFGRGKRWLVIAFLSLILLALLVAISRNVGFDALIEPVPIREDDAAVVRMLRELGQPTEETRRFLIERRHIEDTYRARILQRVENGELSETDAASLFRSMGLEPTK